MATLVKNERTVTASTSNGAGSTTTGSTVNLTTALGGVMGFKMTNGGTGPTIPCSATLQYSSDNFSSHIYDVAQVTGGTANNGVYQGAWTIPPGVMYARVKFSGNTGQAVTVESYFSEATSIG